MLLFFLAALAPHLAAWQDAPPPESAPAKSARATGPIVVIEARYPGANAQEIAATVAIPIELQVNGAQGLVRIGSTSHQGSYSAEVHFESTTHPDAAAQLVRERVERAKPGLPSGLELGRVAVKASKAQADRPQVCLDVIERRTQGWDALQECAVALSKCLAAAGAIGEPTLFPRDEARVLLHLKRDQCLRLGVAPRDVYKVIQERGAGLKVENLKTIMVGKTQVSLAQLVEIEKIIAPMAVYRVNLRPAIRISGTPPAGVSAAEASAKCVALAEAEISRLRLNSFTVAACSPK